MNIVIKKNAFWYLLLTIISSGSFGMSDDAAMYIDVSMREQARYAHKQKQILNKKYRYAKELTQAKTWRELYKMASKRFTTTRREKKEENNAFWFSQRINESLSQESSHVRLTQMTPTQHSMICNADHLRKVQRNERFAARARQQKLLHSSTSTDISNN